MRTLETPHLTHTVEDSPESYTPDAETQTSQEFVAAQYARVQEAFTAIYGHDNPNSPHLAEAAATGFMLAIGGNALATKNETPDNNARPLDAQATHDSSPLHLRETQPTYDRQELAATMVAQQRKIDKILAAREEDETETEGDDYPTLSEETTRTEKQEERREARAEMYDKARRYTIGLGKTALRGVFGFTQRARATVSRMRRK